MNTKHILFVDNDADFLNIRTEFLESAGYRVLKASDLHQAEEHLRARWFHLVILDVRLADDNDERDLSGLVFAKQAAYKHVPKIILTKFPEYVHEVLDGLSPILDFLSKQEKPDVLIKSVDRAFAHRVHINFSLTLDWQATNLFALVSRIEPGAENERERLLNRAEELEDLFRRLFYEKDRIRIDRVLWQRDGRVALTVFAFKGATVDSFVVVCGQNVRVVEEASHFDQFSPKTQGETSTTLADKAETTHFAANAYALAQADLETIRLLGDVYRAGDKKVFTDAVETLFEKTLIGWQGPSVPADRALEELYCERLGLTAERVSPQAFQARWQALVRHIPDLKKIIPNPEPIITLLQSVVAEQSTLTIRSPGALTGDNILVDANGHAWLTDFADAGDVPRLWNFVALESAIRFDWLEEKEIVRLREVEDCLSDDDHFGRPDPQGVESPAARQAVRGIQPIRRLAARAVSKEHWQYHLGIFFNAARRFADFDPTVTLTPNERARLAHALLAMAMITAKMEQNKPDILPTLTGETTLEFDEENHRFKIGRKRANLTPQEFKLARHLFKNADKTCTYRDIIKEVFDGKYDEEYLQTMIDRIRGKIEPDERSPRYILNVRSVGYRLVLQPEE